MEALSYESAGVNRGMADRLVEKIALLSKATQSKKVKSSIGGYASLYEINKNLLLASSTDGVGTKLKLAFQLNEHRTVGIDLVAMSVNDLLCVGAIPLFFLDYFATGKLDPGTAEQVLQGIVEGCKQAHCALVGGETAEMPDFYSHGEYDLAGFAVGSVHPKDVLPKKSVRPGDILLGLASSGCHSNGYSLVRKLLPEKPSSQRAKELLTPTKIYVDALQSLVGSDDLRGLAHITGSGFLNVPRISEKVSYSISLPHQGELPPVFEWIRTESRLPLGELAQTFNLGIGMVMVVARDAADKTLKKLKKQGEKAWMIGEITRNRPGLGCQVYFKDHTGNITLNY